MGSRLEVGVISDTHGLLRPEAVAALAGCEVILHAGDVGGTELVEELSRIAPVLAVRGNTDGGWGRLLPERRRLELAGVPTLLLHDRALLGLDAAKEGIGLVVFGHSHRPLAERRGRVLWFNPGSAGPRRFRLPVSVGRLRIENGRVEGRLLKLDV